MSVQHLLPISAKPLRIMVFDISIAKERILKIELEFLDVLANRLVCSEGPINDCEDPESSFRLSAL